MICCWGDSLTQSQIGEGVKGKVKKLINLNKSYPMQLQGMIGDEYEVVNCGVRGENTLTIMARQGAYPMRLAHDVIVFDDDNKKYPIYIGNNDISAFVSSYNQKVVTPLLQVGYKEGSCRRVNPVVINGKEYTLASQSTNWTIKKGFQFEYNYTIERNEKINRTDMLRKGSIVTTAAMRHLRGAYANVFFIGQNGGFSDAKELIGQLKSMIRYSKCDKCGGIVPPS